MVRSLLGQNEARLHLQRKMLQDRSLMHLSTNSSLL